MLNYCRQLRFTEEPNYDYFDELLKKIIGQDDDQINSYEPKHYDWAVKAVLLEHFQELYMKIILS